MKMRKRNLTEYPTLEFNANVMRTFRLVDGIGLKKGPWTIEEDHKLVNFILNNGKQCWRNIPKLAGLQRCEKSCRLRWINYLRPDLKKGALSKDEENQIIQLHASLGNRWSKIASHFPGRTDNEIKNLWNTRIKKRLKLMGIDPLTHKPIKSIDHEKYEQEQDDTTVTEKICHTDSPKIFSHSCQALHTSTIVEESDIHPTIFLVTPSNITGNLSRIETQNERIKAEKSTKSANDICGNSNTMPYITSATCYSSSLSLEAEESIDLSTISAAAESSSNITPAEEEDSSQQWMDSLISSAVNQLEEDLLYLRKYIQ